MQIYIGNLNEVTTANHLAKLFLPFGNVRLSRVFWDDRTGRSLGIGIVEMDADAGKKAVRKLNRFLFMNSYVEVKITVS
ncbi:MAG: RNA-binding protein [Bacteroidetes bacterium]|nr:RNA-binding protein [Bacteroidota bacterium]